MINIKQLVKSEIETLEGWLLMDKNDYEYFVEWRNEVATEEHDWWLEYSEQRKEWKSQLKNLKKEYKDIQ